MKTMTKVLAVAAVAVLALSISAPTNANCGTNAIISTQAADGTSFIFTPTFQNFSGYYNVGAGAPFTYSYDAGNPAPSALSPNARVSFWHLGNGNPQVGLGNDNGGFDIVAEGGLYGYGYASGPNYAGGFWEGATINTGWDSSALSATDGCLTGGDCMCLLISDDDGGVGLFAILGGQSSLNLDTFMNRSGTTDGTDPTKNAPIVLQPIPGPVINSSNRDGTTFDVTLNIGIGSAGAADYTQDGCNCAPTGYKILQTIVPRGGMPPQSRDVGAWAELTLADDSPQPAGGTDPALAVDVKSACGGTNNDVYLTTQLIFDSGFSTSVVSSNSTRMECGPSLATPGDSKPRPDRPTRPDRPRGGKKR